MITDLLRIAVLALVQGAAELLPVSSSAHVVLAEKAMGLDPTTPAMTFLLVMLHTGTMLAVIVYFWNRWSAWLRGRHRAMPMVLALAIATVCTGLLGLAMKVVIERVVLERVLGHPHGEVESLFGSLPLIAAALFAVGLLIIIAGIRSRVTRDDAGEREARVVGVREASLIGLVQGLCLPFRGFSRSGATISVALLSKLPQALAEDFSFALAVILTPPVIAIELKRLATAASAGAFHPLAADGIVALVAPGLVGMGFSFLAGWIALRWLSRWLGGGRWHYFGVYCLVVATVVAVAWRLH